MKFILITMLLLISQGVYAENLTTDMKAQTLTNKMLNHFTKEEFKAGLALAKPYWPLPEVEIDGLANQINTQWPIVQQRFGKATGFELVKTEKIGGSFLRYYYLHKFENHAIYWQITFYKPYKNWIVNGVTFQDTLEKLYEPVK